MIGSYFARVVFHLRYKLTLRKKIRNCFWKFLGVKLGIGTFIGKNVKITWPHQIELGNHSTLEHDIYFHYDGIYKTGPSISIGDNVFVGYGCEFNITQKITIGNNCLIASGCKFIDHDHGFKLGELIKEQPNLNDDIILHDDVWLGANVIVLKGVKIDKGAIVAAGAVVTKSIGSNEIWGGVPAKKIGIRA